MAKPIVGVVMIASFLLLLTLSAEPSPAGLQEFLENQLEFTPSELSALNMGQIIVRLPRTRETREVAAFAIMRLNVTSDFFVDRMRDIVNFKKSDNVLQIGKFSESPRIADLDNLTLYRDETDTVRRCRLFNCDFKLSGTDIDRFRKEINWSASDYPEHATLTKNGNDFIFEGQELTGRVNRITKRAPFWCRIQRVVRSRMAHGTKRITCRSCT